MVLERPRQDKYSATHGICKQHETTISALSLLAEVQSLISVKTAPPTTANSLYHSFY